MAVLVPHREKQLSATILSQPGIQEDLFGNFIDVVFAPVLGVFVYYIF